LLKPRQSFRITLYLGNFKNQIFFLSQTDMWKKKLESYRDWFLEQENVKVDESKRPDKSFNMSDLFGFEGTFRQLNVD